MPRDDLFGAPAALVELLLRVAERVLPGADAAELRALAAALAGSAA